MDFEVLDMLVPKEGLRWHKHCYMTVTLMFSLAKCKDNLMKFDMNSPQAILLHQVVKISKMFKVVEICPTCKLEYSYQSKHGLVIFQHCSTSTKPRHLHTVQIEDARMTCPLGCLEYFTTSLELGTHFFKQHLVYNQNSMI